MSKTHVALLMGGPSREHNVSLLSGETVAEHIDKDKYCVTPVIVSEDLQCSVFDADKFPDSKMADFKYWLGTTPRLSISETLAQLKKQNIDIVFMCMHGEYGEDGTVQALLETYKIPYTGSKMLASGIAMDKIAYKRILTSSGVATPEAIYYFTNPLSNKSKMISDVESKLGFPCVLKTPSSGSSIGVELCEDPKQLFENVEKLFSYEQKLFVEKYISGREFTCAVLGNSYSDEIIPLPLTEIICNNKFFDFEAKYTPGITKEITPAKIDKDLTAEIQKIAVNVHNLLDCRGLSRTDMIVEDDRIFVLETNTIPGMTDQSLLPQAAVAAGMTISELIDKIVQFGLNDHHND